ncbi:hypothetical protein [Stenotrophomonas sp.]|uniref:hypothetical protein n=1 Tax=Stenotrophomonas sp. TaxID=69392 RepID=UPI00198A5B59|nr:hypothetical protein [Stenotrophomonas sp.]MBD3825639.1 hypothetical protein [Stenotrophomonas sp.]
MQQPHQLGANVEILKRPIIIGSAFAALGVAAVILILGIPKLWTAEAAGWASAIATSCAALVALYVGLTPSRDAARARQRIADSVLKLMIAEASEQSFYLKCAVGYLRREDVVGVGFNHARRFSQRMDLAPFKEALPYFDAMSPDVVEAVTYVIVAIQRNKIPLASTPEAEPMRVIGPERHAMAASLEKTMEALDQLRQTGGEVIGQPRRDHPDSVASMIETWVASAEAVRKNAHRSVAR